MNNNSIDRGVKKTDVNWYPGHMAKTKRLIKEKLDLVDIVYEVVDARIPKSSKIKDIDELIKNKKRILIMTKMDLCDLEETNKWVKYYEDSGYKVILVDLINGKNVSRIIEETNKLMEDMNTKRIQKGLQPRKIRALVVGIPNVGKSTLINRLVGRKAVNVGNKPGVTKSLDWIRINKDIELLDTPGILWPRLDDDVVAYNLASMTAIKEEVLPIDRVCFYILKTLNDKYKNLLEFRYGITEYNEEELIEALDIIGKKRGCVIRGGEIDYEKVYQTVLRDLRDGLIGKVTFD
ncbi:MAG: ribosome biogenesis GTPase YlqF [Firmicutes bacterium]|nr:ribosome biogenesis GTPase YlqF [Bacillota bacterium]